MRNEITKNEARNLEEFKSGVRAQLKEDGKDPNGEYVSLFWGNVFGDEFESKEDAFACGQEAVSNATN